MRKIILYAKFSPFQMFLLVSFFLFSFNFANAFEKNCGEIEGIEFTNGDSTQAISSGGSYNLDSLPENFYVNVNFDGRVRSVRYIVKNIDTNQQYSILENFKPFTFPAGNSPWKLGEGNFSVKVKVYKYRFGIGRVCDQETFIFSLSNRECTADAGTLTADESSVSLESPGVMISAKPNGDIHVPTGYSTIYVLTSGEGLVIEQVNADSPSFTVETAGLYTIHTLVYDGNEDSANYLNLGVVEFGTTTGGQVLGIVGDNGLCAALDVTGAPIMVECTADAGTLTADESSVSLESPGVMISAKPNGDIHVPTGYSTIYVLTSGEGLVIEQVNADSPSFTVETAGLYTIHTLVYDGNEDSANYLNLGVVEFGTTTGGQVLGIVGDNGLCAALDVTGAPIMVECTADAGTLTADESSVSLESPGVMISAKPNGDIHVPTGYSTIYVLTSGEGLVIEQVNADSPSFTVETAGLYTIHTLVYDGNEDSANYLNLGVVEFGTTTGGQVLGIVGDNGLCAALDVTGAPIMVECTADAGTLTADESSVSLESPGVMISAKPNGDIHVPTGYSTIYVLTSGEGLVIEQVNADSPSFTVETAGLYTIHTLVYDGNEDSANYLNLGVVEFGTTTGGQVLGIVGDNGLCAALDVTGAPIMVEEGESCDANAGTLKPNNIISCLSGGTSIISAYEYKTPVIPNGYQQLFVLTNAFNLTILEVSLTPEFDIDHVGFYRIHSLIYNPETLDLGIVQFGQTTGFDVNGLLQQGGGEICASLDVQGAVFLVIPSWICSWFNNSYNSRGGDQFSIVDGYINQFEDYDAFEDHILTDAEAKIYPNPVNDVLNIDLKFLDNEKMSYTIRDLSGRLIQIGSVNEIEKSGNTLNTSQLVDGMYLIKFTSDYRNFVKKIQVKN